METFVRARVDREIKEQAGTILAGMGLNVSDAIRMMLIQVINEGRLPFEVKRPNKVTASAMDELENKQGKVFHSTDKLFEDLGI